MMTKKLAGCLAAAAVAGSTLAMTGSAQAAPEDGPKAGSGTELATSVCLYRIYADNIQDDFGVDEPYLKRSTGTIWGPKDMEEGTLRSINIPVGVGAVVSLWEDDGDGTRYDDDLGTNTIHAVDGDFDVYTFEGGDWFYRISVRPRSYCS